MGKGRYTPRHELDALGFDVVDVRVEVGVMREEVDEAEERLLPQGLALLCKQPASAWPGRQAHGREGRTIGETFPRPRVSEDRLLQLDFGLVSDEEEHHVEAREDDAGEATMPQVEEQLPEEALADFERGVLRETGELV